ncbi:MAG: hypothetical protein AMXMBFR58_08710 [Phycisphaerae bacterium]
MGFQDRRYGSEESGGGFRNIFSGGGFFSWSFPLFTVPASVRGIGGIRVRIHIIYLIIVVSELLGGLRADSAGMAYIAAAMATLFVLVLLHEFGHCLACRWVGGDADEILMWPLGGLAYCRPPHEWKAALITTIGGPGVNVALIPVLGGALVVMGLNPSDLVFNPFRPYGPWIMYFLDSFPKTVLWSAYYTNLVLLGFNVLLPMFPMDGGRILQEILWKHLGYKRSMQIAVNIGFLGAILLGCLGIASGEGRLIGLALFGGITCYNEKIRLASMEDEPEWGFDTSRGYRALEAGRGSESVAQRRAYRRAQKAQQEAQERARRQQREQDAMQEKVDALLDKIRDHGIQSLTDKEREFLHRASEESRRRG